MVIIDDKNDAYFESFTVFMTRPIDKTFRIAESDIDDNEELIAKLNRPRRQTHDTTPKERPGSKTR
jgi:hypothetical protein